MGCIEKLFRECAFSSFPFARLVPRQYAGGQQACLEVFTSSCVVSQVGQVDVRLDLATLAVHRHRQTRFF